MIPALNAALSGLNAAERRIGVSANNIANLASTGRVENGETVNAPYQPQQVQQVSQEEGGVRTTLTTRDPSTVPVYNPNDPGANESGIVQLPNIDLAQEMVDMKIASYDFKANLKSFKAADNMTKSLLDIIT
jgi:flagellar basal-body rod protein FlgC